MFGVFASYQLTQMSMDIGALIVSAVIGGLICAGMAQHVWINREPEPRDHLADRLFSMSPVGR